MYSIIAKKTISIKIDESILGECIAIHGNIRINKLRISREKMLMLYKLQTCSGVNDSDEIKSAYTTEGKKSIKTVKGNKIYWWYESRVDGEMPFDDIQSLGFLIDDIVIRGCDKNWPIISLEGDIAKVLIFTDIFNEYGEDIRERKHIAITGGGEIIDTGEGDKWRFFERLIYRDISDKGSIEYNGDEVKTRYFKGTCEDYDRFKIAKFYMYNASLKKKMFIVIIEKNTNDIKHNRVYEGFKHVSKEGKPSGLCVLSMISEESQVFDNHCNRLVDLDNNAKILIDDGGKILTDDNGTILIFGSKQGINKGLQKVIYRPEDFDRLRKLPGCKE